MILQDPRLRLAFIVTSIISGLIFFISRDQDPEDMLPVVLGLGLLMAALQMYILFGWTRTSPRNQLLLARQLYLRGEFDKAAELLEDHNRETPSADAWALLGNTYRQLSRLERSLECFEAALALDEKSVQASFGMGRTHMVLGDYDKATEWLQKALELGGRKAIRADLAVAMHLQNEPFEETAKQAQAAARVLNLEQYRTLFINYLLYNLVQDERQTAFRIMQNNADGLAYWQTEARRYANSDYGRRIASDVVDMREILAKDNFA